MTLTIQDLGALGGSVAVLVTLVYLALQTRQNTMAIAAQLDPRLPLQGLKSRPPPPAPRSQTATEPFYTRDR